MLLPIHKPLLNESQSPTKDTSTPPGTLSTVVDTSLEETPNKEEQPHSSDSSEESEELLCSMNTPRAKRGAPPPSPASPSLPHTRTLPPHCLTHAHLGDDNKAAATPVRKTKSTDGDGDALPLLPLLPLIASHTHTTYWQATTTKRQLLLSEKSSVLSFLLVCPKLAPAQGSWCTIKLTTTN